MANFRSPPRIQMVMRVAFLKVGKRFLKSEFSDDSESSVVFMMNC